MQNTNDEPFVQIINEVLDRYEAKGKEYGNSYKDFGKVMEQFFPNGFKTESYNDYNKIGIFHMLVHKMMRIANTNFKSIDSLDDLINYAAMLREVCDENSN